MATKVDEYKSSALETSPPAPPYSPEDTHPHTDFSRLGVEARPSSDGADSVLDGPPPYSESTTFSPTVHLQIETSGKPWLSLPLPSKPETIPIYPADPAGGAHDDRPRYLSVRPNRKDGSCYLIPADTDYVNGSASDSEPAPLSTTTYRFGPGKPPQIRLFYPGTGTASSSSNGNDAAAWDSFPVTSVGMLTRAQQVRTRMGTFEWRYGTRGERKAEGADNLLVLDRLVKVTHARTEGGSSSSSSGGKEEEQRTPVAQFVRNAETRTVGSKASTAGNGGRLVVDLSLWDQDEKVEKEMILVLAVTTAVMMLKKEVDRRRAQQIAIMAAAAGGGG